jgi:hypothetical protein
MGSTIYCYCALFPQIKSPPRYQQEGEIITRMVKLAYLGQTAILLALRTIVPAACS